MLVKRTSVVKLPTHVAASYVHAYYTLRPPSSLLSWKDIIIIIMTLPEQFLIVAGVQKIQRALGLRETETIKPESFDEIVCAMILLLFYRYCHVTTVGALKRVCCGSCTQLRIMISA